MVRGLASIAEGDQTNILSEEQQKRREAMELSGQLISQAEQDVLRLGNLGKKVDGYLHLIDAATETRRPVDDYVQAVLALIEEDVEKDDVYYLVKALDVLIQYPRFSSDERTRLLKRLEELPKMDTFALTTKLLFLEAQAGRVISEKELVGLIEGLVSGWTIGVEAMTWVAEIALLPAHKDYAERIFRMAIEWAKMYVKNRIDDEKFCAEEFKQIGRLLLRNNDQTGFEQALVRHVLPENQEDFFLEVIKDVSLPIGQRQDLYRVYRRLFPEPTDASVGVVDLPRHSDRLLLGAELGYGSLPIFPDFYTQISHMGVYSRHAICLEYVRVLAAAGEEIDALIQEVFGWIRDDFTPYGRTSGYMQLAECAAKYGKDVRPIIEVSRAALRSVTDVRDCLTEASHLVDVATSLYPSDQGTYQVLVSAREVLRRSDACYLVPETAEHYHPDEEVGRIVEATTRVAAGIYRSAQVSHL